MIKLSERDKATLRRAASIMERLASYSPEWVLNNPEKSAEYARIKIGADQREHFLCMFLNTQNQLIRSEVLFSGTIDGASVYPRIIVQKALECNAQAVVLAHNHPSGTTYPSDSDRACTERVKQAVELLDIRLLDHVIVGPGVSSHSFAQMDWL